MYEDKLDELYRKLERLHRECYSNQTFGSFMSQFFLEWAEGVEDKTKLLNVSYNEWIDYIDKNYIDMKKHLD